MIHIGRILIGCEYSATERDEFQKLGWEAWSCDLLPSDKPGNHFQYDIFKVLEIGIWDMIILHPPCTALSLSGNKHYGKGKPKHLMRLESLDWTSRLWKKARQVCSMVALENPSNVLGREIGKRTQEINPWQFGHPEQKKTWLWLRSLPNLKPTKIVYDEMMQLPKNKRERIFYMGRSSTRGHERSLSYSGIAKAMAEQWTDFFNHIKP